MRSGGEVGARTGEVEARREEGAGVKRGGEAEVKIGGGAGVRRGVEGAGVGAEMTRRTGKERDPGIVKNVMSCCQSKILGVRNPKRKGVL